MFEQFHYQNEEKKDQNLGGAETDPSQDFLQLEKRIQRVFVLFAIFWTLVIVGIFSWVYKETEKASLTIATRSLSDSFTKDVAYRQWATTHGGVYVPITPETPPSPYLADHPERDITTPSGRRLTLINPAYMTRQVHELTQELYGLKGHITSLNPIRPENIADDWERAALEEFEKGEGEKVSIDMLNGEPHLRLMKPFSVEKGCLACHAKQGYSLGDIRGGVSVSTPWTPIEKTIHTQALYIAIGFGGIWFLGLAGIFRAHRVMKGNLSERRRSLLERIKIQRRLLHTEKLESLSLVTAGVAHFFNNSLQIISGYMDLAGLDIPKDSEAGLFLEKTVEEAKKSGQLTEQMLAFSGQRMFRFQKLFLSQLLEAETDAIASAVKNGRVVRFTLGKDLPPILGDPIQIQRLATNLITNAVEALGEREGSIWLITGEMSCDEEYLGNNRLNTLLEPGQFVFIEVIDSGAGMDEETQSRLFEPFFTSKVLGRGMGMSEVMGIVRAHHGGIVLSSEEGRGTVIRVLLPVGDFDHHSSRSFHS